MKKREGFRTEPLSKAHERAAFSCGNYHLDNYLKTQASQDMSKHVAACFVLTSDGKTIAGFYTLSQYSIEAGSLPQEVSRKLPKYPQVPATLLGRLAISNSFKGQKLGEFLLIDALHRALLHSQQVASAALVVDAKDERAKTFYEYFNFMSFPGIQNRLFLLMQTIEQLFTS
ncbi:MAG TPA: GNAT family N-acetyltransferase [Terriglobales bacterium]|nr:GNAT family N-acetyltransferase [Terriglobales bacterium]